MDEKYSQRAETPKKMNVQQIKMFGSGEILGKVPTGNLRAKNLFFH